MSDALQTLVETYLDAPTPRNREAVVLDAVRLVRALVGRINLPDSPLATREDLEGAGLLGLMQALDSYSLGHGTLFATHAYRRVQGALLDYLREIDPLSRSRRKKLAEAQTAIDTLQQMLEAEPSDEDVADFMGIALAEYHTLMRQAQVRFATSLDHPMGDEGEGFTLLETVEDESGGEGFEAVERASAIKAVQALMQHLPERERVILALYYYENLTLREIGQVLNLTEARISQILGKTLLRLRAGVEHVHEGVKGDW